MIQETEEQIADRHRKATWSEHILSAMRIAQQFPDFTPEQLHVQWLEEAEGYGIDPHKPAVSDGRSEPIDDSWSDGQGGIVRHVR